MSVVGVMGVGVKEVGVIKVDESENAWSANEGDNLVQ